MLICGVIGAVVAYHVELVGIFLVGFSGVYTVSLIITLLDTKAGNIVLALFTSAIPAVIAGVQMMKQRKMQKKFGAGLWSRNGKNKKDARSKMLCLPLL